MKRLILLLSIAMTVPTAYAAPTAFDATYTVLAKGMAVGETKTKLSYNQQHYTYQKTTTANGLAALLSGDTLSESSQGSVVNENIVPEQYRQQHKNKRKNKTDSFVFNSPTQINGQYNDTAYQLTVPAGTLDAAAMELNLMDDLAAGHTLNYPIASKGKLQRYRFQKLGKETISVPAGTFECEKVAVAHAGGQQKTTLWLAPSLNYAIVQVSHQENGDTLETRLNHYQAH